MFDVLINNIFILIPLAIFIAFRIFEARRRQQNSSPEKEDDVRKVPLPHWELEKKDRFSGPSSAGISPTGVPLAGKYPVEVYPVNPRASSSEPGRNVKRPTTANLVNTSVPERIVQDVFPKNLEKLPMLKKAMVFSEILGPPKGLREDL